MNANQRSRVSEVSNVVETATVTARGRASGRGGAKIKWEFFGLGIICSMLGAYLCLALVLSIMDPTQSERVSESSLRFLFVVGAAGMIGSAYFLLQWAYGKLDRADGGVK